MDPARWSSLPRELLPLIFARLPLPQLLGLRRSALEGRWGIGLNGAAIMQLCAQRWRSKSNMCAVLLKEENSATYNVGVVHTGESIISWHKLRLNSREPVNTMCSSDGGLVCFCLTFQSGPEPEGDGRIWLVLAVVNPLTGACRVLPQLGVSPFQLKMMQLVVDRGTNHYQVILVYNEGASSEECSEESNEEFPPLGAMIFCSETGAWNNAKNFSQLFFGPTIHEELYVRERGHGWRGSQFRRHKMDGCGGKRFLGPCAYECATGRLLSIYNPRLEDSRDYALIKDHLFMLELGWYLGRVNGWEAFTLSERQVQVQKDNLSWTKLKVDLLGPEEHDKLDGEWDWTDAQLLACEGFLLVRASCFSTNMCCPMPYSKLLLLYNLGTGEWMNLQKRGDAPTREDEEEQLQPRLRDRRKFSVYGDDPHHIALSPIMMCELDWEAVP